MKLNHQLLPLFLKVFMTHTPLFISRDSRSNLLFAVARSEVEGEKDGL